MASKSGKIEVRTTSEGGVEENKKNESRNNYISSWRKGLNKIAAYFSLNVDIDE